MRTRVRADGALPLPWYRVTALAQPLLWLAVCLLGLYLGGIALYLAWIIPYPYPTHFEEGVVLNAALTLARGGNIYPDNSSPPYISTVYTPLHYLLFAGPLALLGPNMVAPRLLSLFSTLLLTVLIYRWVAWRTSNRGAAMLASLLLWSFFPLANWATAARADTTAVLFSVASVYLVDRYPHRRKIWLAVPLMALAFYTKQTQLAAPLAVGLYLLAVAPRRAIRFGAAYLAAVAIPFLALDLLSGHGFYRHMEYNVSNTTWLWRGKQLLKSYLGNYAGYLLLATGGAIALVRNSRVPLPVLYLATSLLGTASVVASGSDFNHFMENSAVLSVLAGIGLARALASPLPWLQLTAALLLASQLAMRVPSVVPGMSAPWMSVSGEEGRGAGITEPPLWLGLPTPEARATGDRLMQRFRSASGPILSELSAFTFLAGRTSVLDDGFILSHLAVTGKWSQDAFVQQLRRGEIALIALLIDVRPEGVQHTRLTDEMIDAIRDGYQLVETLPFPGLEGPYFYLYHPKAGLPEAEQPAGTLLTPSSPPMDTPVPGRPLSPRSPG